jgi:hypothetical protein
MQTNIRRLLLSTVALEMPLLPKSIPTISSDIHVVNKIITIICIDIYMYMLRMLILLLVSIHFEVKNVSSLRSQIFLY